MPALNQVPAKVSFFGMNPEEFDALVAGWDWPRFRGKQVRDWVYSKLVADPAVRVDTKFRPGFNSDDKK